MLASTVAPFRITDQISEALLAQSDLRETTYQGMTLLSSVLPAGTSFGEAFDAANQLSQDRHGKPALFRSIMDKIRGLENRLSYPCECSTVLRVRDANGEVDQKTTSEHAKDCLLYNNLNWAGVLPTIYNCSLYFLRTGKPAFKDLLRVSGGPLGFYVLHYQDKGLSVEEAFGNHAYIGIACAGSLPVASRKGSLQDQELSRNKFPRGIDT